MCRFVFLAAASTFLFGSAIAQEPAKDAAKYTLKCALSAGEQLHYEVTHVAKTKTRIKGAEDVTQSHTISKRHWDVTKHEGDAMTFDHVIDGVQMTQKQNESDEIQWDSSSGEEAPDMFSVVAGQIGQKLTTITVNPQGQETDRTDHGAGSKSKLGMGSLTLALPEQPIAIGETWAVPREVKTKTEEGQVKTIKIRELYTLEKVRTGVATLSIKSQTLTPISDESIKAQVVQQLSNGEIRFDIDNGRMISKQLDWDETVVGFNGPNSLMEYRARMTEKLVDGVTRTAKLEK